MLTSAPWHDGRLVSCNCSNGQTDKVMCRGRSLYLYLSPFSEFRPDKRSGQGRRQRLNSICKYAGCSENKCLFQFQRFATTPSPALGCRSENGQPIGVTVLYEILSYEA